MTALAHSLSPSIDAAPCDPRGLGGLLALVHGAERALPLTEVRVRASISGPACRTVIEQRFVNTFDSPVEAIHIFPLPEDGAITELELRAGETVVRAECRERADAEATFAEARKAGHSAALLTRERADVHTLRVTRLPPGETVTVRIVVVEWLDSVDGALRWRFPTTIAPRYLPGTPSGHGGPGVLPDTDHVPDASHLQPPLRLEGGTRLDLEVSLSGPISQLSSSLHAIQIGMEGGGLRVAPSTRATLDRDFILAFNSGTPDATVARAWTDGGHTVVLVEPPTSADAQALPRDAVFVVDISGSMGGVKMTAAKAALQSALHGLMPGDRFSLIAFDDRIERFSPDFTNYDNASLARADRWIDQLHARGGTEMLPAIQAALAGTNPDGRLRTVLFITDGQAWNEAELMAAVAHRRNGARFFTLGIDTAVNGSLLKGLARVGGGTAELITPRDDIDDTIARLEARFGSPIADQLKVDGAPTLTPGTAFSGRPARMVIEGAPDVVRVTGRTASGPWSAEIAPTRIGHDLGAIWARTQVAALEDRMRLRPFETEAIRPEILRIALKHGIASPFTAFVAVDRSRTITGENVEVVQPSEMPADWEAVAEAAPARGGYGRRRMAAPPMPASAPMFMGAPPPPPQPTAGTGRSPLKSLAMDDFSSASNAPDAVECADEDMFEPPAEAEEAKADLRHVSRPRPRPAPRRLSKRKSEMQAAPGGSISADPAASLARGQGADGSYGGDLARTLAALYALMLLGHTRKKGSRRRSVLKAARWLAGRPEAEASDALALLARAEAGEPVVATAAWFKLAPTSPEGQCLAGLR